MLNTENCSRRPVSHEAGGPRRVGLPQRGARFTGVSETELEEAIDLAGVTEYFSTLLHGNEYGHDDFVTETDEMFEHLREREAGAADD